MVFIFKAVLGTTQALCQLVKDKFCLMMEQLQETIHPGTPKSRQSVGEISTMKVCNYLPMGVRDGTIMYLP